RIHYHTSQGEETTYCFTFTGQLLSAYSSFISGEPTKENIEALQSTELWVLPKLALDQMSEADNRWTILGKWIAEQNYIELERRVFMLQKEKAEERYADLLRSHPEFVQDIPLQYLASYLGISPRHLSRIRAEVRF
ncbi:MAG: Crp/Fnr family transcriptional regulator, partial [Bacteroidota bacterium]